MDLIQKACKRINVMPCAETFQVRCLANRFFVPVPCSFYVIKTNAKSITLNNFVNLGCHYNVYTVALSMLNHHVRIVVKLIIFRRHITSLKVFCERYLIKN